jgi:hypothetical protein
MMATRYARLDGRDLNVGRSISRTYCKALDIEMRWRVIAMLFAVRVGLGFQFQTLWSVSNDLATVFGLGYRAQPDLG